MHMTNRNSKYKLPARIVAWMLFIIIVVLSVGCASDNKKGSATALVDVSGNTDINSKSLSSDKENDGREASENDAELSPINNLEGSDSLTVTQRNSINMLNYITVLTQEINDSKGSRLFLERAYTSLINNTYPNAVDSRTQAQISGILDTLENYRMITVKRERLEYIYEQNRAQALRQAIPNPLGLLSAVQSGSPLKIAASVVYMAVDSATSYASATSQADMQYLKDGWNLDDEEAAELHESRKSAFSYMISMVRDNSLPGDCALNEQAVQNFVDWKNNTNIVRKTAWLETNQGIYKDFGPYWLEIAKCYYQAEEYDKCLEAIDKYDSVSTRIFRKDFDYAQTLPMAIVSAKEILPRNDYIKLAAECAEEILSNTNEDDVTLRYYVALVYLDLCAASNNNEYLNKAYKIVFDNVNILVDEQKQLNSEYLADIKKLKAEKTNDKNKTEEEKRKEKREEKEINEYNKSSKEKRKKELPPVDESMYLNCDLLFALANKIGISDNEKGRIDSILHENNERIFLSQLLDDRFWFNNKNTFDKNSINVKYDKDLLSIPISCVTDKSKLSVRVTSSNGSKTINDWTVDNVYRPKKGDYSSYLVNYRSKSAQSMKYEPGNKVIVTVTPVAETPSKTVTFEFNIIEKNRILYSTIDFERCK